MKDEEEDEEEQPTGATPSLPLGTGAGTSSGSGGPVPSAAPSVAPPPDRRWRAGEVPPQPDDDTVEVYGDELASKLPPVVTKLFNEEAGDRLADVTE